MARGKRRKPQKTQSLGTNILLFCLSICLLAGASMLVSFVSDHKQLPFSVPDFSQAVTEESGKADPSSAEGESQKSALGEYAFYDLLTKRDSELGTEELHYTIQIAAFKSAERANEYCRKLQKQHRIKCRADRQGNWVLVRWGSFSTKAAAERYEKKISTLLDHDCMVVRM